MEEKNLVPLENDVITCGVLVERNKKRQAEKAKRIFKRMVVILLLIGLVYGAIKLLPKAKDFFGNIGGPQGNGAPITSTESNSTDSNLDSENDGDTESVQSGQNGGNSYTPPDKSTETNNTTDEESNLDSEKENIKDTNTSLDTENNNTYKITELGKTKYSAVNESGCEFDFSNKFQKVTPQEISKKYGKDAPLILITHSHASESYSNGKFYTENDAFYSENANVSSLGKIISNMLNAYGIPTIQLSELYAGGGIFGSQKEYEKSLAEALKKYPSIAYVFDISRGIKVNDDLSMNKSYIEKNGQKFAQIKFVSGTNWDTSSKDQIENVRFAFDFSKFLNMEFDGFVKSNVISRFPLSQNISPFCTNVEIGEYANSYEEAKRSAELFATLLYMYLSN